MLNIFFKYVAMFKLLFIVFCFLRCDCEPLSRLRGVPLSMMSLYPVSKPFTCFDGSETIPFTHINDDYCDCEGDGSDEPGTAACPNAKFFCENEGHKSEYIPSSWVNDGICDCCDTSDEYATNASCENTCAILGKEAKEEENRRIQLYKDGYKIRLELIQKGIGMKEEKEQRLEELYKEKYEAELIKKEKDEAKKTAEDREKQLLDVFKEKEIKIKEKREQEEREKNVIYAAETFKFYDKNNDERLDVFELKQITSLDENKDGLVSSEEVILVLGAEKSIIDFNDFFAILWEKIRSTSTGNEEAESTVPKEENDHPNLAPEESTTEEFLEKNVEGEDDDDYDTETKKKDEDVEDEEKDDAEEELTDIKYDEETLQAIKDATEARAAFEEVERDVRDIERGIKQTEDILSKTYGIENEFFYMVGECYEFTDREYVYKLCPFDQVIQRPKDGGSETRLGTWNNWEGDKYEVMVYSHGQGCWNGPQRQTHVKLSCSTETKVVAVGEPNRCEYVFEFNTPAVCLPLDAKEPPKESIYDEL